MWRLEKDPYLSSTVANVTVLDRRGRLRPLPPPPRAGQPARAPAAPAGAADAGEPHPAAVGRRPRLRPRLPRPPRRPARAGHAAPAARPGHADRRRSRSTAPGRCGSSSSSTGSRAAGRLIQKLHHTVADGEGGVRLSMQFIDLDRDAAEPPPMPPSARARRGRAGPTAVGRRRCATSDRQPAHAHRHQPPVPRTCSPTRRQIPTAGATRPRTVTGVISQLSDAEGPTRRCGRSGRCKRRLEALRSAARRDQGGGQEARRHPEHRVHLRRRRGRRATTTAPVGAPVEQLRASMAISTRTKESGANAFTLARLLVPTGEMDDGRAVPADPRSDHDGPRGVGHRRPGDARRGRRHAADVARDPPGHASRPRRSTSPPRTCGRRRSRATSPARRSSRTTRSGRWPAWRSTSRCCPTTAAWTWG